MMVILIHHEWKHRTIYSKEKTNNDDDDDDDDNV